MLAQIPSAGQYFDGAMSICPRPMCPRKKVPWRCVPWTTRSLGDASLLGIILIQFESPTGSFSADVQRLKELLRNKLRFTWGWAEVLFMAHIVRILNWVAWLELYSYMPLLLYVYCIMDQSNTTYGSILDRTYSATGGILGRSRHCDCQANIFARQISIL